MSLPPLPEGWDRERILSLDQIEARLELSDADQELIQAWIKADSERSMVNLCALVAARTDATNVACVEAGLPTLEEADRAIAEKMGLTDYSRATQKDLFDIAKRMHDRRFEAFGFVVYKTWGYKEEEREKWDTFWRKWNELSDKNLIEMGAVGDLREKFAGKLQRLLIDYEDMAGKGFEEVKWRFQELVDWAEEHIPRGLDLNLCLMIDEEAVDSLLNREDTSMLDPEEKEGRKRDSAFVWGVDVNYGYGEEESADEDGDGEYPGHFKISVDFLMPRLWHTLNVQSPEELYIGKGLIYGGILGDYAIDEAIVQ